MVTENWLSPHWVWLLLAYPLWRAAEACPWLVACATVTALVMIIGAAALLLARDLTVAARLSSGA